jgi:hypothetical protein
MRYINANAANLMGCIQHPINNTIATHFLEIPSTRALDTTMLVLKVVPTTLQPNIMQASRKQMENYCDRNPHYENTTLPKAQ